MEPPPLPYRIERISANRDGVSFEGVEVSDDADARRFEQLANLLRAQVASKTIASETTPDPTTATSAESPQSVPQGSTRQHLPAALHVPSPKRVGTLREVWQRYMDGKKGTAPSTQVAYNHSYALFAEMIGGDHRTFHEIADEELLEFIDALAYVPMEPSKRGIRIGTIAELRKLKVRNAGGDLVDPERISAPTKNGHRNRIKQFISDAIRMGYRVGPNPILDSRTHSDGTNGSGAEAFTVEELKKIFDPKSLVEAGPVVYWGALMSLYTGARANEIASLNLADIAQDGEHAYIRIEGQTRAKAAIHLESNQPKHKRVKNKSSIRTVPLHPALYDIGLNEYISDLKEIGSTRLFPTLPMDKNKSRKAKLSEDFNGYLKLVGVHDYRKKVLHSFRDTMQEILRSTKMDDVRICQWTGRKSKTVEGQHYRSLSPVADQARDAFPMMEFEFIDKVALKYKSGCWNELLRSNMKP